MGVQLQCKKVCILANCALLSSIFILSLRLTVFLFPLPEVQCPKFLDFRNPWGKVMERKGSDLKTFAHKGLKTAAAKKLVFFGKSCLTSSFVFVVLVLLSASVKRFFVSCMWGLFSYFYWKLFF